jgi:hypothetical protein
VALSLSRRHPGERIALVAHGGVLDCLYREATGMTLEAPREHELLNASVNRLRCDSANLTLLQWADVSHLEALTLDEVDRRALNRRLSDFQPERREIGVPVIPVLAFGALQESPPPCRSRASSPPPSRSSARTGRWPPDDFSSGQMP